MRREDQGENIKKADVEEQLWQFSIDWEGGHGVDKRSQKLIASNGSALEPFMTGVKL